MDFVEEKITIEYKGNLYEGYDISDIIVALKKDSELNLVLRDIAKIVDRSYETVRLVLSQEGLNYPPEYPQLDNRELFENYEDQIIAASFNIPLATVTKARKRLGIKKRFYVNFTQRRQKLIDGIFGKQYKPGLNFVEYIVDKLSIWPERQKDVIMDFYIDGTDGTEDTDKVYRSKVKNEIKKDLEDENIEELIERGILIC